MGSRPFQPARQLERYRQRVLAHLKIGRLLDSDVREFYLILRLKNRPKALPKEPLLFAIHPKPLIFFEIIYVDC